MPKCSFTLRWIDTVKLPDQGQTDYFDERTTGLGLRISSAGRKSWFVMYRHAGRLRRYTLGTFPALGLADAREKAKALLHEAALGNDPASEKQVKRGAVTFGQLAEQYIELHAKARKKSWKEDQRILDHDALPLWKNVKAHEIKRRDIIALLDKIVLRAPIQANRTLALVRKLFNWAISRDLLEINPCAQVQMPAKENKKDRVLSEDEIVKFWITLSSASMSELSRLCLQFQLVTAQRKGEIVIAEWCEFDLNNGWWTIPSEKVKNKLSHRVPLSPSALSLLEKIKLISGESRWLFPSAKGDKPIRDTSIDHALHKNEALFQIPPFTPHDLRRTAASHMTSLGVSRLTVSKILNHSESGITAVYDRHSYDREKRAALMLWSDRLLDMAAAKQKCR
ncbi:site-specific integrase [Methylicorpusculum sp.]|uniref:tyrosine-type recombinase/integrase n=1 Tax=Methylicorpusculum sp. TaxID=2713644 RepID=UPI0027317FBD|nr:site-specific integrase [Methylicorpusculum sp.]MDP2179994.1 tyrosine-type recombinase/integrase [Methylicorpusculum sp.]MDP3527848.1 tyrosine-type recombinase/integrase [Methylicorpusculum sp.]